MSKQLGTLFSTPVEYVPMSASTQRSRERSQRSLSRRILVATAIQMVCLSGLLLALSVPASDVAISWLLWAAAMVGWRLGTHSFR